MIQDRRKRFCYQEVDAMRAIRESTPRIGGKPSRTTVIAVYQAFTEIANEQWRTGGREGFEATRETVAAYAGIGLRALDHAAKLLWDIGLLGRKGSAGKPSLWVLYEAQKGVRPEDTGVPGTHLPLSQGRTPLIRKKKSKKVETASLRGDRLPTAEEAPLSHLLADLVAENDADGSRPTVTKRWADAERLLQERDGRSAAQIESVIRWCQADDFERAVVLSMHKLRARYRELLVKAGTDGEAAAPTPEFVDG